jgi:hypothetical protein
LEFRFREKDVGLKVYIDILRGRVFEPHLAPLCLLAKNVWASAFGVQDFGGKDMRLKV